MAIEPWLAEKLVPIGRSLAAPVAGPELIRSLADVVQRLIGEAEGGGLHSKFSNELLVLLADKKEEWNAERDAGWPNRLSDPLRHGFIFGGQEPPVSIVHEMLMGYDPGADVDPDEMFDQAAADLSGPDD